MKTYEIHSIPNLSPLPTVTTPLATAVSTYSFLEIVRAKESRTSQTFESIVVLGKRSKTHQVLTPTIVKAEAVCWVTSGETNDLRGGGNDGLASRTSTRGRKKDRGLGETVEDDLLGVVVA